MNTIFRWPELWWTQLAGLPCLAYYISCHFICLMGSNAIAILAASLPLLATGLMLMLFVRLKWPLWLQLIAGAAVGCLAVGTFYYCVLQPAHWPTDPESRGNVLALFYNQSEIFAAIGGVVAVLSVLLAHKTRASR